MKKRHNESQILKILKEAEGKSTIAQVCREHGISAATFHNWKRKYSGMEPADVQRLKELEDENRKLKRLLADSMLDNDALKALVEKYR